MPSLPIEQVLAGFLRADAGVAALASTRVRAGWIGEDDTFPVVSFTRVSADRGQTLDGVLGRATARIQIDNWAESYGAAAGLAEAVRRALDGFTGAMTVGANSVSVGRCALVNETALPEEERRLWRISQDYEITQTED